MIPQSPTYVGIDFEYANRTVGSICSYGLAFEDGSTEEGFVRLHESNPVQHNTFIHGVTQEQTDGGMEFSELYERLRRLIAGANVIFVAHDLRSDRRALQAAQATFGLEALPLLWIDSLPIARTALGISKNMGGAGVKSVAEHYGMAIDHHNPADDARVSLEILRRNPELTAKAPLISDLHPAQRVKRATEGAKRRKHSPKPHSTATNASAAQH